MHEITNIPKPVKITMRVNSSLRIIGKLFKSKTGSLPFDLTGCTIVGKIGDHVVTAAVTLPTTAGVWQFDINPPDVPVVISTSFYLDLIDSTARVIPLIAGPFYGVP